MQLFQLFMQLVIIKIVEGVEYPIEELIKMTLVPSSNAATIMLANAVDKDSAAFYWKNE